jgi:superfamily I DNA/RNA helicase
MNLTSEQQAVVDYAKQVTSNELILIDSVAGSGKTTLLRAIAEELGPQPGLYLAYNKAIATESSKKFPKNIDCRTTHSLAYKATVVPMKLKVGFFGPKQIDEKIPYSDKYNLVEDIREFCLSKFLNYEDYANEYGRPNIPIANRYLTLMAQGKIECTHDFYLKFFHKMLVEGNINQSYYNLIMLDEAGDLNEVTLEIFKALSGKVKVAVGDPHQNIYTFNHTINCFEQLEGQGTTFKLSKSFRVPAHIAGPVERFCQKYLNPDMEFTGVEATDSSPDIKTRGYISRTNGGLINKIIELNAEQTPYGLVRKAQEIFKVPLMIAGLKYQGQIYDAAYKHLQDDVDNWYENHNNVRISYSSVLGYLKSKYPEDLALSQAINLVIKHGKSVIFNAYAEAKHHENKKQDFMLLTAHSSKGLEFDEVMLAPDMNTSIEELLLDIRQEPKKKLQAHEKESLNLYYVACTRALVRLRNASHLVGI